MPNLVNKAEVSTVRNIVYENLNISPNSYGTAVTNKRYKTEYIDDAIAQADIHVMRILLKSKQYSLHQDIFTTQEFADSALMLPQSASLYSVYYYKKDENSYTVEKGVELPFDTFDMIQEGGIFSSDTNNYAGFFTVQDGVLFSIPFTKTVGNVTSTFTKDGKIGYFQFVELEHKALGTYLYSPDGFEGPIAMYASALLLMKRSDNPEQSAFYLQRFSEEMQTYMTPPSNMQTEVNQ